MVNVRLEVVVDIEMVVAGLVPLAVFEVLAPTRPEEEVVDSVVEMLNGQIVVKTTKTSNVVNAFVVSAGKKWN